MIEEPYGPPATPEELPPHQVIEEPYGPPAPQRKLPPHQVIDIPMAKQFARVHKETGNVTGFFMQVSEPEPAEGYFFAVMNPPFTMAENPRPGPTCVLRYRGGSALVWEDEATLEQRRLAQRAKINSDWESANNTYFEFKGKRVAYKDSDRIDIQGVNNIVMLTGEMPVNPDWPAAWKTLDDSWVPIPDVETWIEFNVAIGDRGTAHFKHAQILKNQLEAATTAAEIEAITW
jgi:hypothetical protein